MKKYKYVNDNSIYTQIYTKFFILKDFSMLFDGTWNSISTYTDQIARIL